MRYFWVILLFLTFSITGNQIVGNPLIVAPTETKLNYFIFLDADTWYMGVAVYNPNDVNPGYYPTPNYELMDSIVVCSNSGRYLLVDYQIETGYVFDCIYEFNSNVSPGLNYSLSADQITILTYYSDLGQSCGAPEVDTSRVTWGSPESNFTTLSIRQQIHHTGVFNMNFWDSGLTDSTEIRKFKASLTNPYGLDYHYKTKCLSNSYDSAKFTVRGFVFDSYGKKLTGQKFWFHLNSFLYANTLYPFAWSPDSSFTSGLLSRNGTENLLCYRYPYPSYSSKLVHIVPFSFYAEPGDTLWIDLHITDSTFYVSSPEIPTPETGPKVTCSPNPFHESVNVYIEGIGQNQHCQLTVADASGKIVYRKAITYSGNQKIVINRNELGKSGIYYLTLSDGNSKIHSKTILMQ